MSLDSRIKLSIQKVIDEFKKNPMEFFAEFDLHRVFEKQFRSRIKENEIVLREYSIPGRRRIDFLIKDDNNKVGVEFYYQKASNDFINSLIIEDQRYLIKTNMLSPTKAKKHLQRDVLRLHAIKPISGYFVEFYRVIVDTRVRSKRKDLANYITRMKDILDFHNDIFTSKSPQSIQTPLFILWDGQSSTIKMFDELNGLG